MSKFKRKDLIRRIEMCGHIFHSECITQWLNMKESCPYCKQNTDLHGILEHELKHSATVHKVLSSTDVFELNGEGVITHSIYEFPPAPPDEEEIPESADQSRELNNETSFEDEVIPDPVSTPPKKSFLEMRNRIKRRQSLTIEVGSNPNASFETDQSIELESPLPLLTIGRRA